AHAPRIDDGNGRSCRGQLGEEFRIEDDASVLEIGDPAPERDERTLAAGILDLEQVSGPVILNRDNGAELTAFTVEAREADEVGVIIFTLFEGRQGRSLDFDQ